ncbi:TPA_asm: hypothetical protein [ssRNA phage Gephyllon.4_8]|uniref:Uncharacterized protein n=2 Tax=Leviviricetes TaxID=2842243 RepID=A0A8S5L0S9_9VIRU|nr:hypothetical protein QIO88_gp3 [ssRNA phage Gephyllon.4_8]QDH87984.1 MAG: hypothetical protein H4BulkLitter23224_000002 [Leviviridae sp.]DAD51510.1 TPA_asm: hypothetical protein [ssRNA phage Gephyllon.4_8]
MIRAKVTGPIAARFVESVKGVPSSRAFHQIEAELDDGDLYVHVHLSWKAVVIIGVIFAQSILYVAQQYSSVLMHP